MQCAKEGCTLLSVLFQKLLCACRIQICRDECLAVGPKDPMWGGGGLFQSDRPPPPPPPHPPKVLEPRCLQFEILEKIVCAKGARKFPLGFPRGQFFFCCPLCLHTYMEIYIKMYVYVYIYVTTPLSPYLANKQQASKQSASNKQASTSTFRFGRTLRALLYCG